MIMIITIIGAAGAYAIGQIHYDWKKIDDILFGAGTLILALLLFLIYYCNTLWLLYVLYVIFGVCFHTLLTITTYGVVFNNFFRTCKRKLPIYISNSFYYRLFG